MTWLTWRQHRTQLVGGVLMCAILLVFLLFTGLEMRSTYHTMGVDTCLAPASRQDCTSLVNQFRSRYSALQLTIPLFLLLPASLGLFWGAPLIAREVEQGTHRLAWTQSVTRRRWMTAKLTALAAAAIVLSAVYCAALWWWSTPLVTGATEGRFGYGIFDLLGVVPVAYTVFAVTLGVAAGVILQRTTMAMVATFFGFAAVRVAVEVWLRPNFEAPATQSYAFFSASGPPSGSWILNENTLTSSGVDVSGGGRGLSFNLLHQVCANLSPTPGSKDSAEMQQCIAQNGIHFVSTFQPYDRYWLFQGIESAIFAVLAVALVAFSLWWVRHRLR